MATRRVALLVLTLAAAALLPACAASYDRHIYESTVHSPKTIRLVDTASHETIWEKAVPVQHRLTIDIDRPNEAPPLSTHLRPGRSCRWLLERLDSPERCDPCKKGRLTERGTVKLPGTPILIKMTERESPEMPPPPPSEMGHTKPATD